MLSSALAAEAMVWRNQPARKVDSEVMMSEARMVRKAACRVLERRERPRAFPGVPGLGSLALAPGERHTNNTRLQVRFLQKERGEVVCRSEAESAEFPRALGARGMWYDKFFAACL